MIGVLQLSKKAFTIEKHCSKQKKTFLRQQKIFQDNFAGYFLLKFHWDRVIFLKFEEKQGLCSNIWRQKDKIWHSLSRTLVYFAIISLGTGSELRCMD